MKIIQDSCDFSDQSAEIMHMFASPSQIWMNVTCTYDDICMIFALSWIILAFSFPLTGAVVSAPVWEEDDTSGLFTLSLSQGEAELLMSPSL